MEYYIQSAGRRLRCGYTTGTCAALAAQGAARALLTGAFPTSARVVTPKGLTVEVPLEDRVLERDFASCAVVKDGGDDVDATHGLPITAAVRFIPGTEIRIEGGPGVGRVTRPGLDQPVGEWAINRAPRRMIREAVDGVRAALDCPRGLLVTISVPGGEEAARRTFNPELGVEGGISILGTSGIVEPMSAQALTDTIALELRQRAAQGCRAAVLVPGNYALDFLKENPLVPSDVPVVKCSNFIGSALDSARLEGYGSVLLVGHLGKLVKVAGGVMDTHSRTADCRTEILCAHAAACGASQALAQAILEAATTDACLDLLEAEGLLQPVISRLMTAIDAHLARRAAPTRAGAVLFTNPRGLLGITPGGEAVLATLNK